MKKSSSKTPNFNAFGLHALTTREILTWPYADMPLLPQEDRPQSSRPFHQLPFDRPQEVVGTLSFLRHETVLHFPTPAEKASHHQIILDHLIRYQVSERHLNDLMVHAVVAPVRPEDGARRSAQQSNGKLLNILGVEQPYCPGMEEGLLRGQIVDMRENTGESHVHWAEVALDPARQNTAAVQYNTPDTYPWGTEDAPPRLGDVIGLRVVDSLGSSTLKAESFPKVIFSPSDPRVGI